MVFHGVGYFPEIDTQKIESFRKEYDPTYELIRAHLTLVFPVDLALRPLSEHIHAVLSKWDPFEIEFNGFVKSWDHWLLLIIKKGNQK